MLIKPGLLIVNLGTPSSPTADAIKKYLGEFLSDRHVVDVNPIIWKPLLHGVVIPKRLKYIVSNYKDIWMEDASPLLYYSEQITKKLQLAFPDIKCKLAMTYGDPSLESAIDDLRTCSTIHVLNLYPQYSTTTTLAAINKIKSLTSHWRNQHKFNYLYDYAGHQSYIKALVKHIDEHICINQPDVLLLSYHGIPISYIDARHDDYANRCERTTKLVRQELSKIYPKLSIEMTFQSKFGKGKWTEPNTSDVLAKLAIEKKSVAVICPGFAVDCIETLYEIDIENRDIFTLNGGEAFQYIPALNDTKLQINMLKKVVFELIEKASF